MSNNKLSAAKSLNYNQASLSVFAILKSIFGRCKKESLEKANRKELIALLKLDDHELLDIGLRKSDIKFVQSLPLSVSSADKLNEIRSCSKYL